MQKPLLNFKVNQKYFRRLVSVFYVPDQVVHRIGAQRPCSFIAALQQKHKNRNANSKKRKMKIKKLENQRDRNRMLQREGISTQYKPLALGEKCLKRLDTVTQNKMTEIVKKKSSKE